MAAYPTTVQHDIVWFWPNSDPKYKDIILKKKPPYIPELDDPSFTRLMGNREIPYGYEIILSIFKFDMLYLSLRHVLHSLLHLYPCSSSFSMCEDLNSSWM